MPLEMHMKIDGVTGGLTGYKHKGWCDIISWSWGMTSNRKVINITENDKTSMNELSVIKVVGIDSPSIRLLFSQSKIIPKIEFNIIPSVGKKEVQTKYVDIVMENVIIKSIITSGGKEDSYFKEHIAFIFDKINFQCSNIRSENTEETTQKSDFSWNITDNDIWTIN